MSDEPFPLVVFLTAANVDEARTIADHLVNAQLAACVQILPEIESVYRWKGEVQHDKEVLILAKTTAEQFEKLESAVRAIHSYETPEIVAVPIVKASADYLRWLMIEAGQEP
jgi:periplasmic divalent cation tolerance protein